MKVIAREVTAREATARGIALEKQRLLRKLGLQPSPGSAASSQSSVLLYASKAGSLWPRVNAVMSLGAFPVHVWGFFVLPDTSLLLYPVAFSLMWVWYSYRKATRTVTALELLPGHRSLRIQTFSFFGFKTHQTVDRMQVAPVFVDASETPLEQLPQHLTAQQPHNAPRSAQDMQILAALVSQHRIGGLDVYRTPSQRPVRFDLDLTSVTQPDLILKLNQFARENAILVNDRMPSMPSALQVLSKGSSSSSSSRTS